MATVDSYDRGIAEGERPNEPGIAYASAPAKGKTFTTSESQQQ